MNLIVDQDVKFLETIRKDGYSKIYPAVIAQDEIEAEHHLKATGLSFSGIFINPVVSRPGGISLVRAALLHHPGTPVFLLTDKMDAVPPLPDLNGMGVQAALKKPITYQDMVGMTAPKVQGLDLSVLQSLAARAARDAEQPGSDQQEYFPVSIRSFLSGCKSFFDVYVRLPTGRYVKLLQAGDGFTPERLLGYLKKGLVQLYIHKDEQRKFLDYCDQSLQKMIAKGEGSVDLTAQHLLTAGQATIVFLRRHGMSVEEIGYALKFAAHLQKFIVSGPLKSHAAIHSILSKVGDYEHGVSCAMVTALLFKEFGVDSERLQQHLGLAAMFHDIGMQELPRHLAHFEEVYNTATRPKHVSAKDWELYIHHPARGAVILQELGILDPAAIAAVEQHHERRNGKGYPFGIGAGRLSLFAQMLGLADEFTRLIARNRR
ncbi:MAG: HD domain-containing phosphohydrolase, partial [Bdellovibrionota bacterium]